MTVGAICNRDVVVIEKGANIVEAAHLMREHHVGALVVTEERDSRTVPVGVITDRDIVVEILGEDVPLSAVKVADVMSPELLVVREEDGIWDTIQRMRLKGVRRVPVVNREGGLEGILAVDDLLELIAQELGGMVRVIGREQARERSQRR